MSHGAIPLLISTACGYSFYRFFWQCPHFTHHQIVLMSIGVFLFFYFCVWVIARKCNRDAESAPPGMQGEWEKELNEGGGFEKPDEAEVVTEELQGLEMNLKDLGDPLDGAKLKYDKKNGCIDFQQFVKCMAFCHTNIAKQLIQPTRQILAQRRQALKDGNEEKYKSLVLSERQLAKILESRIFSAVFGQLEVPEEKFGLTMKTYGSDAKTGQFISSVISQIRGTPAPPAKGSKEAEILSVEKLLEVFKVIMEHEVIKAEQKPPTTPEEQLVQKARIDDMIVDKSGGIEMAQFHNSKEKHQLDQNPEFHRLVQEGQARIQQIRAKQQK